MPSLPLPSKFEELVPVDVPDAQWWRQAVVYQVYPRSFYDLDGNGLGDIRGITEKVPYLKELGIDAVWLSPFYPSELADGGYDVADYRDVAPELGTLADFDEMNSIITAQTGKAADLVRFPGGSSNTISKTYCYGIMSQLVCAVEERGFRYCDWNVSSGDAGGTTSTSQVVANVIEGIKSNNVSVVLQHDIKNFSVDAVEQIIQWGLSEGYTFLPMTSTTPMSHHGVNN